MSSQITICTIISKNYLPHARILTETFLKNNPDGKVFILLVDSIDNKFDPQKEKFTLINIEEIGIKNIESYCFKYTILEQNTGAKAQFLKYLFENYKLKKLAYFDPDIIFTNNLENLWKLLDEKSIVLTPHLTEPLSDENFYAMSGELTVVLEPSTMFSACIGAAGVVVWQLRRRRHHRRQ